MSRPERHGGLHERIHRAYACDRDRAGPGGVAQLHVARLPRAALLVLREAEAVAARRGQGGLVHLARHQAPDVADDQAKGPADGRVGPETGAEAGGVAVDFQFAGDGAVDDHQLGRAAGGGGVARQVELLPQRGLDRGDNNGEVLRPTAGHDGVDGQLLQRGLGVARLHHAQRLVRLLSVGRQHLPDGGLGGRDHRQPVGPPLLPAIVLYGLERVRQLDAAGAELWSVGHSRS